MTAEQFLERLDRSIREARQAREELRRVIRETERRF